MHLWTCDRTSRTDRILYISKYTNNKIDRAQEAPTGPMKHLLTLLTTLLSSCAAAHKDTGGRPKNTSICDYYAAAALGQSNSSTQYTLLTLLVNTALVGNYSNSSTSHVPGILASNATINGTSVNLLPYFDGTLASSNRGGKVGKSINFLDDGGAAPLKENKPSNSPNSNQ